MDEKNLTVFGKSRTLFKLGEKGGKLYIIKSGEVELTVKDEKTGESVTVAKVGAPNVLGTMTFLEEEDRSATATAATEVKCMIIDHDQAKELLKKTPPWLRALIKDMSNNLRVLNAKYSTLVNENEKLRKRVEYQKKQLDEKPDKKEEKK